MLNNMESIEPGRKELVKKCGTYWRFEFGSTFVGLGLQLQELMHLQPMSVFWPNLVGGGPGGSGGCCCHGGGGRSCGGCSGTGLKNDQYFSE